MQMLQKAIISDGGAKGAGRDLPGVPGASNLKG